MKKWISRKLYRFAWFRRLAGVQIEQQRTETRLYYDPVAEYEAKRKAVR